MVTKNTTISISPEFNAFLESHGRYGETKEAILIRLLGDKIKIPTGDRPAKVYSKEDVDSKKTKKKRRGKHG